MHKTEAVRLALAELGDAPAGELAAFVRSRYGVEVPPSLIPIIKATLRDKELLERARASRAAEAVAAASAGEAQPAVQASEPAVSIQA
jgi:ribosomal protein L12E/L44/L45/RPP1/RPP2